MTTILIVDDEFDIVDVLGSLLQAEGYEVITAANGREGLMRLRETRVDLVLLDCMMPVVDGPEMLRLMREDERLTSVPVVMMSAAEVRQEVRLLGCSAFLKKPFDLNTLFATIAQLVGEGSGENSASS
ncbi:MAG TPA: response regulator [Polyangium sp.]|nr:response regulator [Polyangium sp.]